MIKKNRKTVVDLLKQEPLFIGQYCSNKGGDFSKGLCWRNRLLHITRTKLKLLYNAALQQNGFTALYNLTGTIHT